MGKSPAKWIKTIMFGKKDSKSHNVKEKVKNGYEKEGLVSTSAQPKSSNSAVNEAINYEVTDPRLEQNVLHERSATMVQAFFRGYLARRALSAVKSVIRFQALVRGYLVRRQAVATLCSVYEIVKIQALFRGRKERNSVKFPSKYQGSKDSVPLQIAKLTSNAFVLKLLSTSPSVLHLRLSYESLDPNSAPNWLSRWSYSSFWKPNSLQFKRHTNRGDGMTEADDSAVKRSVSKTPSQLKLSALKASSLTKETPAESEFERVKRNLRNVQNLAAKAKIPGTEVEVEKSKILEDGVTKENECLLTPLSTEELLTILQEDDDSKKELKFSDEEDGVALNPRDQRNSVDEQDLRKLIRKTTYNTEKQQPNDNDLLGTPKLPSYMNSTASAKAKLRSQSSPNSNLEASERSAVSWRPTSNRQSFKGNGKNISSPRNGKAEWRKW